MDFLLQSNHSLAFLGDSVVRQTVIGFECELRRRGYNVSANLEERKAGGNWQYQWAATYEMTVQHQGTQTTIRFFAMYRPNEKSIREILDKYPADVLLFDHGLHYDLRRQKRRMMDDSRAALRVLEKQVPLLVWRETSAQHWHTAGGHYEQGVSLNQSSCAQVQPVDRNRTSPMMLAMKELVDRLNWTMVDTSDSGQMKKQAHESELNVIPFRQHTIGFHELHPDRKDCTHFCSTPFLWVPVWRGLRLAIDRAVLARRLTMR